MVFESGVSALKRRAGRIGFMLLLAGMACGNAGANEVPFDYNDETLTGSWGGKRSELMDKGISLNFTHRSDVMANVSGGIGHGTGWLGYTDAQVFLALNQFRAGAA